MTFLGEENSLYETVIFSLLCGISFLLILVQVLYLQKLKSLAVRTLPLLTLIVCYENALSAAGSSLSSSSVFSKFSVTVISTTLPLFFMVLFELPFRLHEARKAHFMCIPFEQGEQLSGWIATISLSAMRIFALGLFVVNVLVNLDLLEDENSRAGLGGYANVEEEIESVHFWMSLVPSMVLAGFSLFISVLMQRYARNFTLGIRNSNHYWRYMLPCSILYTVGQCFGAHIYRWTSLAGDVFLVIGISIMVHRVQSDLAVAGSFADFLHRSNAVFRTSQSQKQKQKVPPQSKRVEEASGNYASPDEIRLEQLENGETVSLEDEAKHEQETSQNKSHAGGITTLVKSDRSLMNGENFNEEEPELHAL